MDAYVLWQNTNLLTPTAPPLENAVYEVGDLDLDLRISGAGNIQNKNKIFCNKLILTGKISGAGNMRVIKKNFETVILSHANKQTERVSHEVSSIGNIQGFGNTKQYYDEIVCNATISGAGNIALTVHCNEIQWRETKITGSGGIYENNRKIDYKGNKSSYIVTNGTIISSSNGNITIGNDPLFYFYTKNGNLRFTNLSLVLMLLAGAGTGISLGLLFAKLAQRLQMI